MKKGREQKRRSGGRGEQLCGILVSTKPSERSANKPATVLQHRPQPTPSRSLPRASCLGWERGWGSGSWTHPPPAFQHLPPWTPCLPSCVLLSALPSSSPGESSVTSAAMSLRLRPAQLFFLLSTRSSKASSCLPTTSNAVPNQKPLTMQPHLHDPAVQASLKASLKEFTSLQTCSFSRKETEGHPPAPGLYPSPHFCPPQTWAHFSPSPLHRP